MGRDEVVSERLFASGMAADQVDLTGYLAVGNQDLIRNPLMLAAVLWIFPSWFRETRPSVREVTLPFAHDERRRGLLLELAAFDEVVEEVGVGF